MDGDLSYFEGFYGDLGALRFLFSSRLSEDEGEVLPNGQD